ncbi:MAG: glycosyltransferase [Bacteroidetes bacterium]|nr:glycosyltransferase [Bacteroidota bacterium]
MRLLLLSDANSEHTQKWAIGLAQQGIKIGLFSLNKSKTNWYAAHQNISMLFEPKYSTNADKLGIKLSYISYVFLLKKHIRKFKPDIVHAHYATSYGLIGALTGFRCFIISVWGSDVYNFPNASYIHKKIFKFNLKRAKVIFSTSHAMKFETIKYTDRPVFVTPFGIDCSVFYNKRAVFNSEKIKIGTIKAIEEKYGISYIIEAANILNKSLNNLPFELYLIGACKNPKLYLKQINTYNLTDKVFLTGKVNHDEIADYHNSLDIFLNVSVEDSESFGVATVEAMACERPVIVSNVGGLKEVVENGNFGKVVERKNAQAIASEVLNFIANPSIAKELGTKAREHVLTNYNWSNNLQHMINHYNTIIEKFGN